MSTGINVTATGLVPNAGGPGRIGSLSLAGGSANATAVIRDGGASGTIIRQVAAVIGSMGGDLTKEGIEYAGQLHVTLTGTGASLNIELL
jgi:hypothetical protein